MLAGRRPVSCGRSLISIWIFGWQCEHTATLKPNFFRLLVHAVYLNKIHAALLYLGLEAGVDVRVVVGGRWCHKLQ